MSKIVLFSLIAGLALQTAPCNASNSKKAATKHKDRQERPIQLGVSGGSIVDSANGYCCSGTLGSLVKDKEGKQYILSNTHVLAGDSVKGNNKKVSAKGDSINQPGYIDVSCKNNESDYVAKLSRWVSIVPDGITKVDAAIAEVEHGKVASDGKILEIGTISSSPKAASVGQKVKKSGRTSGLTTGKISALHATISVSYSEECGGKEYTSTFHDQILITPGSFLQGGDSGSLMVEDVKSDPRPIGLLFAGSSQVAIANPIEDVLKELEVEFVGAASKEIQALEGTNAIHALIAKAKQTKNDNHDLLMSVEGAVGHAVGVSKLNSQNPTILLLITKIQEKSHIQAPKMLNGIPVELHEVGEIRAY
jgi:hypothetical protein